MAFQKAARHVKLETGDGGGWECHEKFEEVALLGTSDFPGAVIVGDV